MRRHLAPALVLLLIPLLSGARQEGPQTRAEATDFRETSRYADVRHFLQAVAAESDRIHLTTFGYSMEGRALPLAVVGAGGADASSVRADGRTRVFVQANIHAGEVCGKEAMLMLLRELAAGAHPEWDEDVVLLIAPIYNADGNEVVRLTNRSGQNGPFGGMGQRPNAQGLDLNRDHMKLESPEARSLVRLFNTYDPHVVMDLHTTNGTAHAYHLTYSPPLHPNTHPSIVGLLRQRWLPAVTDSIRERFGWEFYYYGNLSGRGEERGWYTFDHRPRFNNNYVGLRNRFAVLSEAYAYASFEERVRSTLAFVEHNVDWIAAHAAEIRARVATADAESLAGRQLALRATFARSAEPVTILMGDVETAPHPLTGQRVRRRLNVRTEESVYEYGTFQATLSGTVPRGYVVVDTAVRDLLIAHGVALEPLPERYPFPVEAFYISGLERAEREFQGHREVTLEGQWGPADLRAADPWLVRTDQPLGRLVFTLLEPQSDDGVADWDILEAPMSAERSYPIFRVPQ